METAGLQGWTENEKLANCINFHENLFHIEQGIFVDMGWKFV